MNIFCNKNNVADAHAKLINDEKAISDEDSRRRDPTNDTWSLFKS